MWGISLLQQYTDSLTAVKKMSTKERSSPYYQTVSITKQVFSCLPNIPQRLLRAYIAVFKAPREDFSFTTILTSDRNVYHRYVFYMLLPKLCLHWKVGDKLIKYINSFLLTGCSRKEFRVVTSCTCWNSLSYSIIKVKDPQIWKLAHSWKNWGFWNVKVPFCAIKGKTIFDIRGLPSYRNKTAKVVAKIENYSSSNKAGDPADGHLNYLKCVLFGRTVNGCC